MVLGARTATLSHDDSLKGGGAPLTIDPLRRAAKLHAAQLGDLEFELFDLQRFVLDRKLGRLQFALTGQRKSAQCGEIGGQFGRGERHV
jgi:hypothetical protein